MSTITSAGIDAMYGRVHGEKEASAEFYQVSDYFDFSIESDLETHP